MAAILRCGVVELALDRPRVMGILNVTADSFSDGGRFLAPERAIAHGLAMAVDGADLVDVGGESTRPGAEPIALEVELARVMPVLEALVREGVAVSVDTMKPEVMRRAIGAVQGVRRTWFCGDRFTLADIMAGVFLVFGTMVGQPLDPANKNLAAIVERVKARPSFAA